MLFRRTFTNRIFSVLLLAADKEGTGGAGATLKQQLEQATSDLLSERAKLTTLEGEKLSLSTEIGVEKAKVTKLEGEKLSLSTEIGVEKAKVTKLEGEKLTLSTEVATLKDGAKSADQLAAEKAAANGIVPVKKDHAKTAAQATDGPALYAEYEKLKGRERTAFMKLHETALMAHAKDLEKQG
jgi:chromosome segregation ATPase